MQLDGVPSIKICNSRSANVDIGESVEFESVDGLAAFAGGARPRAAREGIAPPGSDLPNAMHSTIPTAISWFIRSE
jgi:hypothetical protein